MKLLGPVIVLHRVILTTKKPTNVPSAMTEVVMQRNASYPPAPTHMAPTTMLLADSDSMRSDISLGSISTPFSVEKDR